MRKLAEHELLAQAQEELEMAIREDERRNTIRFCAIYLKTKPVYSEHTGPGAGAVYTVEAAERLEKQLVEPDQYYLSYFKE